MKFVIRTLSGLATIGLLAAGMQTAEAQDAGNQDAEKAVAPVYTLLNLDTPEIPQAKRGLYSVDLRAPGGSEGQTYWGFGGLYALRPNVAALLRTTISDKRTYNLSATPFSKGGSEIELGLKAHLGTLRHYEIAAQASVVFPDTGRNKSVYFAGQAMVSRKIGDRTTLYFVPKLITTSQFLLTLGGGVNFRFDDQWSLMGDIQGAVSGDNTFSTFTGNAISREVWGVGVRYTPSAYNGSVSLDLGVTNGLGRTTGYSMQPALSGSAAFYVQFLYRH